MTSSDLERRDATDPFSVSFFVYSHGETYNNQILHGDQTRREENYAGSIPSLTRDLFAVANLLFQTAKTSSKVRTMPVVKCCNEAGVTFRE